MTTTKCRAKNPTLCRYHGTQKRTSTNPIRQTGDKGYKNEIIFIDSLVALSKGDETALKDSVQKFLNLPSSSRTLPMANITDEQDYIKLLTDLDGLLKTSLNTNHLQFSQDKSNQVGSDLQENVTGTSIELKLGSETAVNAGLSLIKEIFDEETFALFPDAAQRDKIEKIYTTKNETTLLLAQKQELLKIKTAINSKYKGKKLSSEGQYILSSYFRGINSLKEIKENYKNGEISESERKIRKYSLLPNQEWVETTRKNIVATKNTEDVWFTKEAILDEQVQKSRLNILVENPGIGYGFKIVLNGKNNGKKFGTKAPAKLLLNSFNCWFYPLSR